MKLHGLDLFSGSWSELSYGVGPTRHRRSKSTNSRGWKTEPNVGRVADGIPNRVDRLKCFGNAVVPEQAKEAFKELMGL